MFRGNANAGVYDVNPNKAPVLTATEQDPATWLGIPDRIADQIANYSAKEKNVAYDPGGCVNESNLNALLKGRTLTFKPDFLQ